MRIRRALAAGGATPVNPSTGFEHFGASGASGAGTSVAAGGVANTIGDWVPLSAGGAGGALENAITELEFFLHTGGSASARYLVEIGVGEPGAQQRIVAPMWVIPNTAGMKSLIYLRNLPAGSKLWARAASTGGGATIFVRGRGRIRVAGIPPWFDNCERIWPGGAESIALTLPNTVDVAFVNAADTGWTTYKAATDRAYGALTLNLGMRASVQYPVTANQYVNFRVGIGDAGGGLPTQVIHEQPMFVTVTSPLYGGPTPQPILHDLPAGVRLAVELVSDKAVAAGDVAAPILDGLW